jgi:hypothetical protein
MLVSVLKLLQPANQSDDYYAPGYWSLVECQVGIICANMPAIYQLIKVWKPKLVSGTTRGATSRTSGLAATPDVKGSIVAGKFMPHDGTPRPRILNHTYSDSTEYLQWSKEMASQPYGNKETDEANTIELGTTRGSPSSQYIPPGQAF